MKRIQQTEQLSDGELKAVLRGDEASLGSLIWEDAANVIAGSAGSAIARIMSKTKTAFQRERMGSEGSADTCRSSTEESSCPGKPSEDGVFSLFSNTFVYPSQG